MSDKQKLAWLVSDPDEGYEKIVFHHHALAARRIGAERLGMDFESVEIERKQQYDSYADRSRVPVKVLLDDGWWFECFGCSCRIERDENECNMADVVIEDDESYKLWCSAECKAEQDAADQRRIDAHKAFKEAVLEKRPDLTFTKFTADNESWAAQSYTPYAEFTFPGAKHGGGTVRIDNIDVDTEIRWYVAQGDHEAWNQYEASRDEK